MSGPELDDGAFGELNRSDLDDIFETSRELDAEQEFIRKAEEKKVKDLGEAKKKAITDSDNVQESVRDAVRKEISPLLASTQKTQTAGNKTGKQIVEQRRRELREMLEGLGDQLEGKTPSEVAATLASFMDMTSQLSLQKTEGVITVKCRLASFFLPKDHEGEIPPELRQETSLIFSPEEVEAIRDQLETYDDDEPMKPFFTSVLDQAFDVVQYNEMTGMLLVEMTKHFLDKLDENGYSDHSRYADFNERHKRTMASLGRAIEELRDVERTIRAHLKDLPILEEFPKALRLLIQVRLGMLPQSMAPELIATVRDQQNAYGRARGAAAFDFNRLPSFQHGVRLRQSAILNLHRDVLKFTAGLFEEEFEQAQAEFKNLMDEMEATTADLNPNSPEYAALMKQKTLLQEKIAVHRRKLDIVKSQESLVDVQHKQVQACLDRYNESDPLAKKAQEIQERVEIDPSKIREQPAPGAGQKKKAARMATSFRR